MDTTKVPGHTRLYPDRLDLDASGRPLVFATAAGGIGYDNQVLRWQDSTWSVVFKLGYHTAYLHPVIASEERLPLLWQTVDNLFLPGVPYSAAYLVSGRFVEDRYTDLDTISTAFNVNWIYSGATSGRRKWAIKSDGPYGVRVWYSDTVRIWHGVFLPGRGSEGVAAAALDDTTALMIWGDTGGPFRWGTLSGAQWHDEGAIPGVRPGHFIDPHFRRSPSGALWLVWSTAISDSAAYVIYRDGAWTELHEIGTHMLVSGSYFGGELRPSRDAWEQPVITWVAFDGRRGFLGTVCVSVPDEHGYPPGENLAGTDDAIYAESVRDRNGDVWLIWRTWDDGMFWTHSYVRATARSIALEGHGRRRTVAWTLDEPAPGSGWIVLRSRDDGPFEEAGRVLAGAALDLSWADDSPPGGTIRYRVRRECLDARYRWESAEVSWPPGTAHRSPRPHGPALKQPARPLGMEAELEMTEAARGPIDVALYDLQGRRVLEQRVDSATGDRVRFSLGNAARALTSGIFFARVRDASGIWSPAVRVVVLK